MYFFRASTLAVKVCSHMTFAFAFASTLPSKFNIASMEMQTQMHRMGLNPFWMFYIDVDANANVRCEHSFTLTQTQTSSVKTPLRWRSLWTQLLGQFTPLPWKFNIVSMVTDNLTHRMGDGCLLKRPSTKTKGARVHQNHRLSLASCQWWRTLWWAKWDTHPFCVILCVKASINKYQKCHLQQKWWRWHYV